MVGVADAPLSQSGIHEFQRLFDQKSEAGYLLLRPTDTITDAQADTVTKAIKSFLLAYGNQPIKIDLSDEIKLPDCLSIPLINFGKANLSRFLPAFPVTIVGKYSDLPPTLNKGNFRAVGIDVQLIQQTPIATEAAPSTNTTFQPPKTEPNTEKVTANLPALLTRKSLLTEQGHTILLKAPSTLNTNSAGMEQRLVKEIPTHLEGSKDLFRDPNRPTVWLDLREVKASQELIFYVYKNLSGLDLTFILKDEELNSINSFNGRLKIASGNSEPYKTSLHSIR